MGAEPVIRARGVTKRFRLGAGVGELLRGRLRGAAVEALSGADLEVAQGEFVGIVGCNGAGKSTLLRILGALLIPDGGEVRVLGRSVMGVSAAFRRRVCYIAADERSFSWRISGRANLEFFAALMGVPRRQARDRVAEALEGVGLGPAADRAVRRYSSGMRTRLALARGLLGEPELWLFDEISRGVDPAASLALWRLIRQRTVESGHTAVAATHNIREAQRLCNRVAVFERGRVVATGKAADLSRLLKLEEE